MLREKLLEHTAEKGFRWRGGEMARIEGLSDAVFAFAVTLLVVSLEVPKTFTELAAIMRGFVPFAICFALLMNVWHEQYIFFRRYNLQDTLTIIINLVLLFVVLFYVYPLKFLFTLLVNQWTGAAPHGAENPIEPHQVPQLMAIFSGGYFAVSCVFLLLFRRALSKAAELELTDVEVLETRRSMGAAMINVTVSLISLVIVWLGGGGLAGLIYPILLSPGFTVYYTIMSRKKHRLAAAAHT